MASDILETCKTPCNLHGIIEEKLNSLERCSNEHDEIKQDIDSRVKMSLFQWLFAGLCTVLMTLFLYIINSQSEIKTTLQQTSKDLAIISERTQSITRSLDHNSKYIEKIEKRVQDHINNGRHGIR